MDTDGNNPPNNDNKKKKNTDADIDTDQDKDDYVATLCIR